MKRLHAHIFVKDIKQSVEFYSQLFATVPSREEEDYVRWELVDPPLNFAISNHGNPGIDHLGIQFDSNETLQEYSRANQLNIAEPKETGCCYARSYKTWLSDPQNVQWEMFHTQNDEKTFFGSEKKNNCCTSEACC